jgi:dTDP-glucose pyrophosphorylase/CBS domain-containing protein
MPFFLATTLSGVESTMYSAADIDQICIDSEKSMFEAVSLMNGNRLGVVLVIDGNRRLIGVVSDGDVRRKMLEDLHLNMSVASLLESKSGSDYERPITGLGGQPYAKYLEIMQRHSTFFLPLLDGEERVIGLVTMEDILAHEDILGADSIPVQAVVMAGGKGMRLRPLTDNIPKPMLNVGNRPLLERIIEQLRDSGIRQVNIATHYKPEKIIEHFGDGSNFGVDLNYVSEDEPLGTAGALGLMDKFSEPVLVMNGDILTGIDFHALVAYHEANQADMTVAVRKYDFQVPYGVVECEGSDIRSLSEKPVLNFFVNAGIYLLQPTVSDFIVSGEYLDMNELIEKLIADGRKVVSFPIIEYWLDIGQIDDYERAQKYIEEGKL